VPQDALAKINVTSGKAGTDVGLLKDGKLDWPLVLRRSVFTKDRTQIEQDVGQATKEAVASRASAEIIDRLANAIDDLEAKLSRLVGKTRPSQYIDGKSFLRQLDDAVRALELPGAGKLPGQPDKSQSMPPRVATRLESVDEIRQAVGLLRTRQEQQVATGDTTPFRPQRRPPIALLCIFDDQDQDGEWVRLRGDTAIIGRTEGDITIPHDNMMSSRHAELARRVEGGRTRWHLTDLQSTNGTFVRVASALLKHNQELLLGSCRFRFQAPAIGAEPGPDSASAGPPRTQAWEMVRAQEQVPVLVRLSPSGEHPPILLDRADNLLGRNPNACRSSSQTTRS
jgi:hypothetical protein